MPQPSPAATAPPEAQGDGFGSCGDEQELFTIFPLALEDFNRIVPLGNLAPAAHTIPTLHHYIDIRKSDPDDPRGAPAEVPLYAPADLTITEMNLIEGVGRPDYDDYAVVFQLCEEFKAYLDHLKTVSPKIREAYDAAPTEFCREYTLYYETRAIDWRFCKKLVNIEISAGERLGTAGGGEGQNALDFAAFDYRLPPHTYANPDRWDYRRDAMYVVCPLDYFPLELKEQLKARLGGRGGAPLRTAEPVCGEVAQDIPGTAQGIWFPPSVGAAWDESQALALVHDNLDPSQAVFSNGLSTADRGLPHGLYYFTSRVHGAVNRDFKDVAPGTVYCYEELVDGMGQPRDVVILLDLTSETTLRIEGRPGRSCGSAWEFVLPTEFER